MVNRLDAELGCRPSTSLLHWPGLFLHERNAGQPVSLALAEQVEQLRKREG